MIFRLFMGLFLATALCGTLPTRALAQFVSCIASPEDDEVPQEECLRARDMFNDGVTDIWEDMFIEYIPSPSSKEKCTGETQNTLYFCGKKHNQVYLLYELIDGQRSLIIDNRFPISAEKAREEVAGGAMLFPNTQAYLNAHNKNTDK